MTAQRLSMLARDALAAGATSADGFTAFVTQRAPDLSNEAKALGDLVARGLVAPLDNDAIAPQEDVPIAADLSSRLGVPLTSAQAAITAARLLSEGGQVGGSVPSPTQQPYVPGGPAPTSPKKSIMQQPIAWVGAAAAAGLLYYTMKPDEPRELPNPNPTATATISTNPTGAPTGGPTGASTDGPVQPPQGGASKLDLASTPQSAPVLQSVRDPEAGLFGVHFRFREARGMIEAMFVWPAKGPNTGNGILIKSAPGAALDTANPEYRSNGSFRRLQDPGGLEAFRFEPEASVTQDGQPEAIVEVAFGKNDLFSQRGAIGIVIVTVGQDGQFGLIPN